MYFHPGKLHLLPDNPACFQNFSKIIHMTLEILSGIFVPASLHVLCQLQNHTQINPAQISIHMWAGFLPIAKVLIVFSSAGSSIGLEICASMRTASYSPACIWEILSTIACPFGKISQEAPAISSIACRISAFSSLSSAHRKRIHSKRHRQWHAPAT